MHFTTIFKSLKNKDMLRRVLIIFGILVAYRLLAQIPVPMGDANTFKEAISNLMEKSDFSSFLNLISGGGLASFSIIFGWVVTVYYWLNRCAAYDEGDSAP